MCRGSLDVVYLSICPLSSRHLFPPKMSLSEQALTLVFKRLPLFMDRATQVMLLLSCWLVCKTWRKQVVVSWAPIARSTFAAYVSKCRLQADGWEPWITCELAHRLGDERLVATTFRLCLRLMSGTRLVELRMQCAQWGRKLEEAQLLQTQLEREIRTCTWGVNMTNYATSHQDERAAWTRQTLSATLELISQIKSDPTWIHVHAKKWQLDVWYNSFNKSCLAEWTDSTSDLVRLRETIKSDVLKELEEEEKVICAKDKRAREELEECVKQAVQLAEKREDLLKHGAKKARLGQLEDEQQ